MKRKTTWRTAARDRQTSASFRPSSEIRVSRLPTDNEALQDHDTYRLALYKSNIKDTANVDYGALRVTAQIEDSVDDDDEPSPHSTGNDAQRRRSVGFPEEGRHRTRKTGDAPKDMQTMRIDRSKMVDGGGQGCLVDYWRGTRWRKGGIVRLDSHVVRLKNVLVD